MRIPGRFREVFLVSRVEEGAGKTNSWSGWMQMTCGKISKLWLI